VQQFVILENIVSYVIDYIKIYFSKFQSIKTTLSMYLMHMLRNT
jgi:hypothetical protein